MYSALLNVEVIKRSSTTLQLPQPYFPMTHPTNRIESAIESIFCSTLTLSFNALSEHEEGARGVESHEDEAELGAAGTRLRASGRRNGGRPSNTARGRLAGQNFPFTNSFLTDHGLVSRPTA